MCAGPYGQGLAKALVGEPQWLLQQQEPVVFEQIKFDVRGGFPFSLFEHHRVIRPEVSCLAQRVVSSHACIRCALASERLLILARPTTAETSAAAADARRSDLHPRPRILTLPCTSQCHVAAQGAPELQTDLAAAAQDVTALEVYADMVDQVKAFYKLQDRGLSQPLKVVIAQRSEGGQLAQRVISNAPKVADALKLRGIDTQVG